VVMILMDLAIQLKRFALATEGVVMLNAIQMLRIVLATEDAVKLML